MADKYSFLVIKYPRIEIADEALDEIKKLAKAKVVKLRDAVSITKTADGKIKLHQTKDDSAGKGLVKGGVVGVLLAAMFGPVGWVAAGALLGTALGMFDRGIKNKLLNELGEKMSSTESALAILVEQADWPKAIDFMRAHDFKGEIVVLEIAKKDTDEVEKLFVDAKAVESVPEEMDVPAPVEVAAAAVVVEEAASETAEGGDEAAAQRAKKLEYIEGVGPIYSQKLIDAGITTVDEFLARGSTPQGRKDMAKATGISDQLILRWVNMADLYRIKGIGQEYAELLEAAGVDTVPELAQRVPANLLPKMVEANEKRKMVRRLPVLSQVESWVEQAKSLPRIITY
jgi:uncharacterized membrane protein